MKKFFVIFAVVVFCFDASVSIAGYARLSRDSEDLYVTSENWIAQERVTDALLYAGYSFQRTALGTPRSIRADKWCRIEVEDLIESLVTCYASDSKGGLISVRVEVFVFNVDDDYSVIPKTVKALRFSRNIAGQSFDAEEP